MFDNSLKIPKYKSKNYNFQYIDQLKKENLIDSDFVYKINFLKIEDLIYLKLESAMSGFNGKLLNFPINKFIADICKEACLKYALSATNSKKEAAMVMGISKSELNRLIKLHRIDL